MTPLDRSQIGKVSPPFPLLTPIQYLGYPPDFDLLDRIGPRLDPWQEQNRLLDLGRQFDQPHDVGHSYGRDLAIVSKFGLALDDAVSDELLAANCQGHDSGDSGFVTGWSLRRSSGVPFDSSFDVSCDCEPLDRIDLVRCIIDL